MFLYQDLLLYLCKWNHALFISTFLIFTVSMCVPRNGITLYHSKTTQQTGWYQLLSSLLDCSVIMDAIFVSLQNLMK